MTKAIFAVEGRRIMFDCINHAEDHDVCTIISTLCNVLVEACFAAGKEPTTYNKGHVRIDLENVSYPTLEVFRTVENVMRKVAEQHPENVSVY